MTKPSKYIAGSEQASQAFCQDLPMDFMPTGEEEGHYWSWHNAPRSIPNQYRECMLCGLIDAREWLSAHDTVKKQKAIQAFGEKLLKELGYHFEPAHPADCECWEYGSDTTKDGWWKDGDFISSAIITAIQEKLGDTNVQPSD